MTRDDPPRRSSGRWPARIAALLALIAALTVAFLAGRDTRGERRDEAAPAGETSPTDEAVRAPGRESPPPDREHRYTRAGPRAQPSAPPAAAAARAESPGAPDNPIEPAPLAAAPAAAAEPVPWFLQPPSIVGYAHPRRGVTIGGVVTLGGPAPQMPEIDPWADPRCQMPSHATEEEVLVDQGKLANVLVRVIGEDAPDPGIGWPSDGQLKLREHECQFVPRVAAVVKPGRLSFENSDNTDDDLTGLLDGRSLFHLDLAPHTSARLEQPLATEGVLSITAAGKPWMRSYVIVASNPFFAITNTGGQYQIFSYRQLREGPHTLEAWHERYGTIRKQVTVTAGKPVRVDFNFAAPSSIAQSQNP